MEEKKSASRDTIDETFDSMTPFEEEGPPSIEQVETPPPMTVIKSDHSKMKTRLSALASPFKHSKSFHIGSSKRGKFLSDKEEDSDRDAKELSKQAKKTKKSKTDDEDAGVEGEEEGGVSAEEENAKGKKKKKGARSRAGALVRRLGSLGGRRSTSKDAANKDAGAETSERRSSGSSSLTPGSVKRRTPEGEDGLPSEPSINDESGSHYGSVEDVQPLRPENMSSPLKTEKECLETEKKSSISAKVNLSVLESEPPLDIVAIATTHPVSTLPFAVSAWRPKSKSQEIEKPIESPSPEDAVRRRIAFVAQATVVVSEDREESEGGEDHSNTDEGSPASRLSRLVRLARQQKNIISGERSSCDSLERKEVASQERDEVTDESEYEETEETRDQPAEGGMPPFGDIIEGPDVNADMGSGTSSHPAPMGGDRRERLYKILVIGELGTGKTSIIKRYVHQFFSQHYRATIGVDFALKVLNWDSNTTIRLQLWDIAGQERFGNMTRVYYKEAVGAFIVFDVTRVATFEAVVKWKQDLDSKVQLPDGSPIPCVLLANKCDHQKEGIVNTPAKMDEYCREKGFAGWYETSAKENINIEEAARSLVNKILLNDTLMTNNDGRDGDKFALEGQGGSQEESSNTRSCAC